MIAVDTSALMAILLAEPKAEACMTVLQDASDVVISAGTVAEALIVAGRRGVAEEMARLIDLLALDVSAVTPAAARQVAAAYERWGKGIHPTGLNLGDCFVYEVAQRHACPLLFVGDDFARTDLESVLA